MRDAGAITTPVFVPARAAGRTRADDLAARNRAANLAALSSTQPALAGHMARPAEDAPAWTWTFARDGALSALDPAGRWWGGCSVPRAAGRAMLQRCAAEAGAACFLAPLHPKHLLIALQRAGAADAVLAILPDGGWLALALGAADLSAAIRSRRLWLACEDDPAGSWELALAGLLDEHPGLPIPKRFIHTPVLSDERRPAMVAAANRLFSDVAHRRAGRLDALRALRDVPRAPTGRICLLRPSRFRPAEPAAHVLAEAARALPGLDVRTFDPDDPAGSSGLALALAAAEADAILVADASRAHLGQAVGTALPIITWLTGSAHPPAFERSSRDILLAADERTAQCAREAGWPADRVFLAPWPPLHLDPARRLYPPHLAMIGDTVPLAAEPPEFDLSSHRVLWESIRDDLLARPLMLGEDVGAYLRDRMARLGIPGEGLDVRSFAETLIIPAWQQGLADLLLSVKLPLRLHGSGWSAIDRFRGLASPGPIGSLDAWGAAVAEASLLVPATPGHRASMALAATGRPVIDLAAADGHAGALVRLARRLLDAPPATAAAPATAGPDSPGTLSSAIAAALRANAA